MVIPILISDFERFNTSLGKETADVIDIAGELELEVEPQDLLQSNDET